MRCPRSFSVNSLLKDPLEYWILEGAQLARQNVDNYHKEVFS